MEAHWWTMTSAFGRFRQTDSFTWVEIKMEMERGTKRQDEERKRRRDERGREKITIQNTDPVFISALNKPNQVPT